MDCLLTKNRGYPLWIPSPSISLPKLNRRLGVCLGDVGVLTPEGGFNYLFNVLHDAAHPINAPLGVPEGFVPLVLDVPTELEFVEWNGGSYLADPSIIRVDNGDVLPCVCCRMRAVTFRLTDYSNRLTVLEATSPEAAVLMIPKEIRTNQLKITTLLKIYVKENIATWYRFVKHTLGRDIENGELRVVYGYRKSSGFGIATAFNTYRRENTRLTFWVDSAWAGISGCPYRWSHIGTAEVKAGPYQQENPDISSAESARNQCLFVNTMAAKVSAEIWKCIEELENATPVDLDSNLTSSMVQSSGVSTQAPTVKSDTPGVVKTLSSTLYDQVQS